MDYQMGKDFVVTVFFLSFFLSTALFRKAAGSLSLKKLNIISFVYYALLAYTIIGAACVLLGFRDHYLIVKINDDVVILKTCLVISYVIVVFPLTIMILNCFFISTNMKQELDCYYSTPVSFNRNEDLVYKIVCILALFGVIATVYVFICIGNIPVISLLKGGDNNLLRQAATRNFSGMEYIRNIVMLVLTPIISYLAYVYWRVSITHKIRWKRLFIFLFVLSVVIKTYNLEKAPVIYYVFYFYIIEVLLGNQKLFRLLIRIAAFGIITILFMYYVLLDYRGNLFTISSGPGGRIFMTQVATLFLHIKAFPEMVPYLEGASLPTIVANFVGAPGSWIRSGRVVMELFNKAGVEAGTAGVMNALFVGEAYANWGLKGVILSPFVVAVPFFITMAILLKTPKTPISMTCYIALMWILTNSIHGGFVDYIYNASVILLVVFFLMFGAIKNNGTLNFRGKRYYS